MRIYLVGAHSTGKTTLARHLSKATGLPLLNEVIRQVMAEKEVTFDVMRSSLDIVNACQLEVFERQMAAEKHIKNFISDRAFDNLAYASRQATVLQQLLKDPRLEAYVKKMQKSIVFFVRPHKVMMKNAVGREPVDWDEIQKIDGIIDFILAWKEIPAVGINDLTLKSRLRSAMAVIQYAKGK